MHDLKVSGCILAGGRGTRLGGTDKGLVTLGGITLIEHAINRLSPQVDRLVINANRNTAVYENFGWPVIVDANTNFDGPLQGFYAGLDHAEFDCVAFVPCDCPFFPLDLVQQLTKGLTDSDANISVAVTQNRAQPAFAIVRSHLKRSLGEFLSGGGRKIFDWIESETFVKISFTNPEAFDNINTPADLRKAENQL